MSYTLDGQPHLHRSKRWPVRLSILYLLLTLVFSPCLSAHPDLDLQIEELTMQLAQNPDNTELLLKRGDLQRRHENWDLARADFKRVRQVQPGNEVVDWMEGRLDVEAGQPERGVRYLDRFLETHPEHAIALQNRAKGHLLLGQPLLAAQDYHTVILSSDKPAPALYSSQALALVAAGVDHFPAALVAVKAGLQRFPAEITLSGIGTDISLARGNIETAAGLFEPLPASILKLPRWQTRKALLECQAGRRESAMQLFNQATANQTPARHMPGLLSEASLTRLMSEPTVANCQAAALEILQSN